MKNALQYEQLQLQMDYPVMRRQVHEIHRGDNGFITYAWRELGGEWKQWHYLLDDLVKHLQTTPPNVANLNQYISINSFRRPQRTIENLWHLNGLFVDIDYHEAWNPGREAELFLADLEQDVFGKALPFPSLVTLSGRGLQLVWILKHLPKLAIPFWALSQEAVKRRLDDYVTRYEGTKPTVDNCTDISRVFRLCGSYNPAAGVMAQMVSYADNPPEYRLDALRDQYFPELRLIGQSKPKRATATEKPTEPQRRVRYLHNAYTLHMARMEDIQTLRRLRQEKELPESCRRRMVFLYRYWCCCATQNAQDALESTLEFNQGFCTPLPDKVVERDTRSAEKAFVEWKAFYELSPDEQDAERAKGRGNYRSGYNYKTEKLIKFLDITEDEQKQLKTIVGKAVKYARRNEKAEQEHWRHNKRDGRDRSGKTAKQRALENERDYARRLSQMGMTQRQIAAHMEVSQYKVYELLKEKV